ncbi:MAG: alpha/beta fold hydrolase [Nitrososphaerota archaeon]|nr:alpha/beta fold hydrolase [Nitrososphaerota archaeon]MDG7023479.1 alpha/beta fold hydrolase [Nitrososphaerota archaeon]
MPTVRANGIDVYYETYGSGDPILVIGGLGSDLTQLQGLVGRLAERHLALAFDNRGVGRSDKPDEPYTIETMAEDAAGLLDTLNFSSVNVLGISLGGRIAIMLALLHPSRVKTLTLLSTSARASNHQGLLWSLSNLMIRIPSVRAWGTKYPQPYYSYVRQRDASKGFDATPRLKEIVVPTLILHGTKDRIVPFALALEMHAGIAGSKLQRFEGGHLQVFSKPSGLAASVVEFLASGVK